MVNENQVKSLTNNIYPYVQSWNHWREQHPGELIDLSSADLRNAYLPSADLEKANLRSAKLIGADLRHAILSHADLSEADLSGADLSHAYLNWANLHGASLRSANMTGTILNETLFCNTDLTGAQLADCHHGGPSTIDHRTISRSRQIHLNFLRGCGVPETLIDKLCEIRFQSCFISYSSEDETFARHLCIDLQRNGVRCWFAHHDLRGGKKLHEQIGEAIQAYDRVLLVLSDHSMKSEWVKTEIANAREREATEERRILFPIAIVPFKRIQEWKCFDGDRGKDSAREIREYYIPNFCDWNSCDSYAPALRRLLADLAG